MTLLITLVTPHGVWSSTDHRLTEHPSRRLITDSSVKHVVVRCPDGAALVSYTGLGRVARLDVSAWMREILRGESRTVDETLIDLREQATARFGMQACAIGVAHAFAIGAFVQGEPWWVEIRNMAAPTAVSAGGLQPGFETAGDGTIGFGSDPARTDDCLRPAIATLTQIAVEEGPDPRLDQRLLVGEHYGDVNREAWGGLIRWAESRGLRINLHETVPLKRDGGSAWSRSARRAISLPTAW